MVEGPEQWAAAPRPPARGPRGTPRRGEAEAKADDEDVGPPQWLTRRLAELDHLTAFVADLAETSPRRPASASWREHLDYLWRPLRHLRRRLRGAHRRARDARGPRRARAPRHGDRFAQVVRTAIEGLRVSDVADERQGAFARRGVNVLDVNSLRHLSFRASRSWGSSSARSRRRRARTRCCSTTSAKR